MTDSRGQANSCESVRITPVGRLIRRTYRSLIRERTSESVTSPLIRSTGDQAGGGSDRPQETNDPGAIVDRLLTSRDETVRRFAERLDVMRETQSKQWADFCNRIAA